MYVCMYVSMYAIMYFAKGNELLSQFLFQVFSKIRHIARVVLPIENEIM